MERAENKCESRTDALDVGWLSTCHLLCRQSNISERSRV